MRIKKFINQLYLAYFHFKSLKLLYFVPLIFLFIILPFSTAGDINRYGIGEHTFFVTQINFQVYIPFMSIWWVVFGLREYVEGKGKELLFVYKKSMVFDFFIIFIWYFIHVVFLFIMYAIFFHPFFDCLIIIFVQSLVFSSVTLFFMSALKTIAVPFLISIFYEIFCMFSKTDALWFINMLYINNEIEVDSLVLPYLPLVAAALILIFISDKVRQKRLV